MSKGIDRIKREATAIASKYAGKNNFGHGFLWVQTKRGNRFVAAYCSACSNHSDICREVEQDVVGVEHAWINLD